MTEDRTVQVEGQLYTVVVSDEKEALLAAAAAGRASLGIGGLDGEYLPVSYVAESIHEVDEVLLEKIVRRTFGFPWNICETQRLKIREFQEDDWVSLPEDEIGTKGDRIFTERERLKAYIACQYRFYEFGIWAVVEKEHGRIIGKTGFSVWDGEEEGVELGYHIFSPYRGKGYAWEACLAVLEWEERELGLPVWLRIEEKNQPSVSLAEKLGFVKKQRWKGKNIWIWQKK